MSAALRISESAIRTGGWRVPPGGPRGGGQRAGSKRKAQDPDKYYLVFNPGGEPLGYIWYSDQRPALERGGPTYLLKRCPIRPLSA